MTEPTGAVPNARGGRQLFHGDGLNVTVDFVDYHDRVPTAEDIDKEVGHLKKLAALGIQVPPSIALRYSDMVSKNLQANLRTSQSQETLVDTEETQRRIASAVGGDRDALAGKCLTGRVILLFFLQGFLIPRECIIYKVC